MNQLHLRLKHCSNPMKILRSFLIYGMLVFGLTACPFLEPPAPLAPLPIPKVKEQKDYTSLTTACHLVKITYNNNEYVTNTYDTQNRIIREEASNGNVTTYSYDTDGYLQKYVFTSPPPYVGHITVFEYDSNKIISKITATDDKRDYFGFNTQEYFYEKGRLLKYQIVQRNNPTPYILEYKILAWDSQGRPTEKLIPKGSYDNIPYHVYYKYDEVGNVVEFRSDGKAIDRNAYVTTTTYDNNPTIKSAVYKFKGISRNNFFGTENLNNRTYSKTVYSDGSMQEYVYSYTYNASGFPIEYFFNGVRQASYEYAGCIQ